LAESLNEFVFFGHFVTKFRLQKYDFLLYNNKFVCRFLLLKVKKATEAAFFLLIVYASITS